MEGCQFEHVGPKSTLSPIAARVIASPIAPAAECIDLGEYSVIVDVSVEGCLIRHLHKGKRKRAQL